MVATIDLNRVAIAVEVIERGSFTAAAAALGMPKSSVSRGVAALEQELGVTLLKRTTRKLDLTEAGRQWFERARGAIAELELANAALSHVEHDPHGIVRMTAPPDVGSLVLGALISFHQRYPRVHVELVLTGRRLDLVEEGIDLALRAGRLESSALIARKLFSTNMELYAAPEYIKQRGRPRAVAELGDHECVLFQASRGRVTWQLSGPHGQVAKVEVTGPISADELNFVVDAMLAGAGIALAPGLRCDSLVEQGRLERLLPGWCMMGNAVYLLHTASAFLPRRVEVLRDHLVSELASRHARQPAALLLTDDRHDDVSITDV